MKIISPIKQIALTIALTIAAVAGTAHAGLKSVVADAKLANGTGKKAVLIYYANETHEDAASRKNVDTILSHLRSSDHEGILEMADAIERDRTKFSQIVEEEVTAIKAAVVSGKLTDVVIFTNEMAARGEFEFVAGGEVQSAVLSLPRQEDVARNSHPLADAASLQAAMKAAAEKFSPETHEFVLITKSHGSPERAMIPRIGLDVSDISRDELLAKMTRKPVVKEGLGDWDPRSDILGMDMTDELGMEPTDDLGMDMTDDLGITEDENLGVKGTMLVGDAGTTKDGYATTLATAACETGMTFRLVFVESCKSELNVNQVKTLSNSVGTIFTSGTEGLDYQTLDYTKVLNGENIANSINNALNAAAAGK